jgi:hypothetical protein
MITVKIDNRNWLQFPDGTPEAKINERITRWIKDREHRKKKEIEDLKDLLARSSKPSSYSDELSRLTILNQYKFIT